MTPAVSSMLMVVGLWLGLSILCCGSGQFDKPLSAGERAEALRTKEKACNTVDRLKSAGAFTKIEAGYSGVTHAYAGSGFFEIPIDSKKEAVQWVALCNIDLEKRDQPGLVIIHNGYSGKRIGTFDFSSGLRME